ncbi:hypothetical protein CEB3_c15240 [Peptococcaceae bacterium CEB3]|nr:hypothetical protein CEB3_c15240 [Peptococcaceae bacterium CEB3]
METDKSTRQRTHLMTRRHFLGTILGVGAGYIYFRYLPLVDDERHNVEQPGPLLATTHKRIQSVSPPPSASHLLFTTHMANASRYMVTPTYDRSGQAVHPSVIDFKTEYGLQSWGGSRYWMALTPFPYFWSTHENPSLLVSEDGLRWNNPPGIKNPLVPRPLGLINRNYNSDPELIYDPNQNMLILYWRQYSEGAFEKIWAKKIFPNHRQSNKILCFEKKWDLKTGLDLSPTVWRKSAKEWYMWTTDGNVTMHSYTSGDGFIWSSPQPCNAPWNTWNGGYIPWHIAAKPNHLEQTVEFLIAGWPKKGTIENCQLLYATAPMSNPKELSMPLAEPLLRRGTGNQWDNGYIYRSSFVREPGSSHTLRIWYSACSSEKVWHFGYTEGQLSQRMSSVV